LSYYNLSLQLFLFNGFLHMKTGRWLNHKVWTELSFFVKREANVMLVFWLIVFMIVAILKVLGLVK
jgi:hypothetical protein